MSILNLNKKVLLAIICFLFFVGTVTPCVIIAANYNLENKDNMVTVIILAIISVVFGMGFFVFSLIHFIEKKQRNDLISAYFTVPNY